MKMKRIIVLFLLFSLSLSLFATETIWLWDHNDDRVTSFRYSTSYDEEWRVVPGDHYSVKVDSRDIYDYIFFLQQSYDGKAWSNSSVSIHGREVTEEAKDTMVYGKYSEEGFSFSLFLVPFQSYVSPRSNYPYSVEKKSAYSIGLDLSASYFFASRFGLGIEAEGSLGWSMFTISPFSYSGRIVYGGAYLTFLYRFLDGARFEILSHIGFGSNYEIIGDGKIYLSPSFLFSIEGGIKINSNVTVSMKPSFTASFSSWKEKSDYISFTVKTIAIGVSYRM